MRCATYLSIAVLLLLRPVSSFAQHKSKLPPEILSAKSVYLDDRIGSAAISREMVVQLRKWGRFQIVNDPKDADLVLLLSADPYKDGELIFSNGQTGSIDIHGNIKEDPVPTFNKQAPVRYAYLTAIDPRTRQSLWSADHQWGGLLTGFNSVGARLLNKLKKQIEK